MFRKQDLPLSAFFAITIISVALLVLPMWNYSMFYLAWSRIDYTVSNIDINATQVNVASSPASLLVKITLLVTNPTGYSGLKVGYATCDLEYYGPDHLVPVIVGGIPTGGWIPTTLWNLKVGSDPQWYQLGPNTNRTILLEIYINPNSGSSSDQQNAVDFLAYLGSKPGNIAWFLDCDLSVNSFLGELDAGSKYFTPITSLS
jgi:hypothetical protein